MAAEERRGESVQASIEVVGTVPFVVLAGLVAMQLLAVGYAKVLADTAAEAGALALVAGGDPRAGVREALPGWSRARARVDTGEGRVTVRLRPPSVLRWVGERLEIESVAAVEAP